MAPATTAHRAEKRPCGRSRSPNGLPVHPVLGCEPHCLATLSLPPGLPLCKPSLPAPARRPPSPTPTSRRPGAASTAGTTRSGSRPPVSPTRSTRPSAAGSWAAGRPPRRSCQPGASRTHAMASGRELPRRGGLEWDGRKGRGGKVGKDGASEARRESRQLRAYTAAAAQALGPERKILPSGRASRSCRGGEVCAKAATAPFSIHCVAAD